MDFNLTSFRTATVVTALVTSVALQAYGRDYTRRGPDGADGAAVAHRMMVKKSSLQSAAGRMGTFAAPVRGLSKATAPARAAVRSEATLFGAMIGNEDWGYYDRPVGLYSINPNTGACTQTVPVAILDEGQPAGTYSDGKFYASVTKDFYGYIQSITNVTVDVATGSVTTYDVPEADRVYANVSVNMSADPVSGTIYSINYGESLDDYVLCTFDPAANTYTRVAALTDHYWAFCISPEGVMYGVNDFGEVKSIDMTTGAETATVAATNFTPATLQSACWSPTDKRIYWAACNYSQGCLIAIDPATGVAETLTTFAGGAEFIGLYCTDPVADAKAPAGVDGLRVNYASTGSTRATVSCTMPRRTVDGSALHSPFTFTLSAGGKELVSTTVLQPGEQFSGSYDLPEGPCAIEAVCTNEHGRGVAVKLSTFTGIDAPGAVVPQAMVMDYTTVSLTWTVPDKGANGGDFDASLMSFNVLRDGTPVATGLTTGEFSDKVSELIATYRYEVETVYAGAVVARSLAVSVPAGRYAGLPYSNTMDNAGSFATLTVIDGNADGITWTYDEYQGAAAYSYSRTLSADDYLVLPCIRLQAGHAYEVAVTARGVSASYPERFGIVAGPAAAASSLTTEVMAPVTPSNETATYTGRYLAEADADVYFAVHGISDPDMSTLYVYGVTVTDMGNLEAPQAPVIARAEAHAGEMKTDLSFVLPALTNAGAPLAAISRVEVSRDGAVLHTARDLAPGATIDCTVDAVFGFNTYLITAYAGDLAGVPAVAKVFAGQYTLPFAVGPTADEFTLFTAETNPSVDDNEWYYDISANALKISTYKYNDTDQFIFTPAIEFGDANQADLTFDVCAGHSAYPERLEVTLGTSADRSTHTTVLGTFEFNNDEFEQRSLSFSLPAAGRYYVGFHAVSDAQSVCLSVRNINIQNGARMLAPAAVTDAVLEPGAEGDLSAVIRFTVPTTDLRGDALGDQTVDFRLLRADGTEAATLTGAVPGTGVSMTDEVAFQGMNTYTLISSGTYGRGGVATVSGWVGIDIPSHINALDVLPTADNLGAVLTWTAPTEGIHGGWLDPSNLRYRVYQLVNGKDLAVLGETSECTYTAYPAGGTLDFYYYYIAAFTEAGEGITSYTGAMVGNPATLPMIETASNRIITNLPWISGSLAGNVNWGVADYIGSLDLAAADGGMFVASSALPERRPGAARMQLPKLTFRGLAQPTLRFKVYHYDAEGAGLLVSLTSDEVNYTDIFATRADAGAEGWETYTVNLSDYRDCPWVSISFDATLTNGGAYMIVDDIEVVNIPEYDIAVTAVRGKANVAVGEKATYLVEVTNRGRQHVMFDLSFRADGRLIGEVHRDTPFPADGVDVYSFDFTPVADNLAAPVEISVEAAPVGWTDETPGDNGGSFLVNVIQPELPVVSDLAAASSDEGVVLTWTAPSLAPDAYTDNFDDYESFSYADIGDYTLVDLDGLVPCGIQGVTFPNMGTPMAFQVWEPLAPGVDVDADIWAPHSGAKCLVAWTALSTVEDPYNDDWLISPELFCDGTTAQQVSFFAKRPVANYGPESFEVLWSDGSADTADFELLASETVATAGWLEFRYALPVEARRFAIRYTSRNRFALLFDDLTYTRPSAAAGLAVESFGVYRDGTKIATVTDPAYTDTAASAGARYNVTVNYNRGESQMSNTATLFSGITAPALEAAVTVAAGAIIVRGASEVTVATPSGIVIPVTAVSGEERSYRVSAGLYIVSADGAAVTVAVK